MTQKGKFEQRWIIIPIPIYSHSIFWINIYLKGNDGGSIYERGWTYEIWWEGTKELCSCQEAAIVLITGPGHVLKLSPECRKYASGPSPVYDSRQQCRYYISPSWWSTLLPRCNRALLEENLYLSPSPEDAEGAATLRQSNRRGRSHTVVYTRSRRRWSRPPSRSFMSMTTSPLSRFRLFSPGGFLRGVRHHGCTHVPLSVLYHSSQTTCTPWTRHSC